MLLWLFLAGSGVFSVAFWRLRIYASREEARLERAKEIAALAQPWLNGIPLPHVDDPRWHAAETSKPHFAYFGPAIDWPKDGSGPVHHFRVERSGSVLFQGCYLGQWEQYAAALFEPIDRAQKEREVRRAIDAMDAQ